MLVLVSGGRSVKGKTAVSCLFWAHQGFACAQNILVLVRGGRSVKGPNRGLLSFRAASRLLSCPQHASFSAGGAVSQGPNRGPLSFWARQGFVCPQYAWYSTGGTVSQWFKMRCRVFFGRVKASFVLNVLVLAQEAGQYIFQFPLPSSLFFFFLLQFMLFFISIPL